MPSHVQQYHPSLNHLFLPPLSLVPVTQQLPMLPTQKMMPQQYQRRSTVTHQRLTRANVGAIDSKDSRQARWHRVLSYVAQVRSSYATAATGISPISTHSTPNDGSQSPTSSWISDQERIVATPPDEDVVDPLMNSLWGAQPMKIRRSLWDGGSCGTDGVDQFVWDDELDSGGNRFTLPPRSQQGDFTSKRSSSSRENSPMVFSFDGCPTASSSESRRRAMDVDDTDNNDEQRPSKRQRSNESLGNQIKVTNANISKTHALALEQYLETLRAIEKSRLPMMKKTIDYDYGFGGPDRWRQVYGVA